MKLNEVDFLTKKHISALNKKNIFTLEDVLDVKPIRYYIPCKIQDLEQDAFVAVSGIITRIDSYTNVVTCTIEDENQETMRVTWFHLPYISRLLKRGTRYVFFGKNTYNKYNDCWQLVNPIFEKTETDKACIKPMYRKIRGISDETYMKLVNTAFTECSFDEIYSERLRELFSITTHKKAYRWIHKPKTLDEIKEAKDYFLFHELFSLAVSLHKWSPDEVHNTIKCNQMQSVPQFIEQLPFALTDGPDSQLETVRAIIRKINRGKKTNSLVQGDVSCGKTMVAIILMLIMAENGYQSVLVVPTNVLAKQHYQEITRLLRDFSFVSTALLTACK